MKEFKKALTVFGIVLIVLATTACSIAKEKETDGGWETAEDGEITTELQELFDKAMEELEGVNYTPVKLLETQVVSGTNYKFLCDATVVSPDAETKQMIVTIYQDLQGNVEILDIQDAEQKSDQRTL